MSLPSGGGAIRGIGETFEPDQFTGVASFSIPIKTSQSRGLAPELSLGYSSGSGNGPFGLGFDVSLLNISRRTETGIPQYKDSDTFVLSDTDTLTPKLGETRSISEGSDTWHVTAYVPEKEGLFASIEHWTSSDNGESHWRIVTRENITHLLGHTAAARISDPSDSSHIFKWLIEETFDSHGNKVCYRYKEENLDNVPDAIFEINRSAKANRYLEAVEYGNYWINENGENEEWFAYETVFDYGEYDLDKPNAPQGTWLARKDPFSSYRAGFEIRTFRLCRNILLFHRFKEMFGGERFLVHALHLEYDESPTLSLLKSVQEVGFRKDAGSQATPPVTLGFSSFAPTAQQFKLLTVAGGDSIPGYLADGQYLPVDLYGEGLPGILYSDDQSTIYWKPEGDGHFGRVESPANFPTDRDLSESEVFLMDLDANGQMQLVVTDDGRNGFYAVEPDRTWRNFQSFTSWPLDFDNPFNETVDLRGNGLTDLLLTGRDWLKPYLSKGRKGFGAPKLLERHNEFPAASTSPRELVTFADMFGDGLQHRVRIRDGIVECWPNLGYGRFGAKVTFGNAPRLSSKADDSRLFLADIDGSGTTDLIYLRGDRLEIFVNQSGNSFSDPVVIELPMTVTDIDQITFADVLGVGASSMVLTKIAPEVKHYLYDFTGGAKPYLLNLIDNNLGATTVLQYASSTKFYLEDRDAGQPWITRLPFPVHVVERVESIDRVSGSKLVNRFKYHHGYFDPHVREFNGFGFVERWDTEEFAGFARPGLHAETPFDAGEEALHVPPVLHKSWYHTGAWLESEALASRYAKEFFQGDQLAHPLAQDVLAGSVPRDAQTLRQAYRALKGVLIREEIYGEDNQDVSDNPYVVSQTSWKVRLVQPRYQHHPASFYVYDRETITYEYERDPQDPRTQHQFTLEVDDFGNVPSYCTVFYPRRELPEPITSTNPIDLVYPEQKVLRVIAGRDRYINVTGNRRWLGVPCEGKNFELNGLTLTADSYFTFDDIKTQVDTALANEIPYGVPFTPGVLAARAFAAERYYYWNEDLTAPLPLGAPVPDRLLGHHTAEAVFTPEIVSKVYADKVTNEMLSSTDASGGGYVFEDGHWWDPGLTAFYFNTEESFYLLARTEDDFGGRTLTTYDPYRLSINKVAHEVAGNDYNTIEVTTDYYTIQPAQVIDENDNYTQFLFDPLGNVIVTTEFGITDGKPVGDEPLSAYVRRSDTTLADVLARPHWYLQKASNFFFYDLFAFTERGEPASAVELSRFTHVSDLLPGEETVILTRLAYSDGFDRIAAKMVKAEPDTGGNERWIVTGRTVYNNKALPVKEYLPYYTHSPEYRELSKVEPLIPPPTVTHYDAVLRTIRVDTPKDFFRRYEFKPWATLSYDEDDTVKDSRYYQDHIHDPNFPEDERDALEKAAVFYDTPEEQVLDNAGRTFLNVTINVEGELLQRKYLVTRNVLDVTGNVLEAIDPREVKLSQFFDMRSELLSASSPDVGTRLTLDNIFDNLIHNWDDRGIHITVSYDRLERPVETHVAGNDNRGLALDHVVQRISYGETVPDAKDKNLRGQMYQCFDQAGVLSFNLYNLDDKCLDLSRQLLVDYRNEINWSQPETLLEPELFTTIRTYDALGELISETTPDGSTCRYSYGQAGRLKQIHVTYADQSQQTFIEDVAYDAAGQELSVQYGNGATTTLNYEWTTQRLENITTTRSGVDARGTARATTIQNVSYFFDPAGNVTRNRDHTHQTVFCDQQKVEALSDYTYDALYRLIRASGRQHPGIQRDTHINGFKQSLYLQLCQPPHPNDFQQLQMYGEEYAYDDSGNMTRLRHYAPQTKLAWTRDIEITPGTNRMAETQYDANGNTLDLENLRSINWNYRNNIARIDLITREDETSDSDYYVYDYTGNRVRKVIERYTFGGTVTRIEETIYLGNLIIRREQKEAGGERSATLERQSLHVMNGDTRVAITNYWEEDVNHHEVDEVGTRQTRYQLFNLLNSSVVEVDANADVISFEEYFPFGGTAVIAGNVQSEVKLKDFRYAGKECDDSTGLYYYGARYYVTWLGRWLNPDPAGPVDGLNVYVFVGGNPIGFVDPDGLGKKAAPKTTAKKTQAKQAAAAPKKKKKPKKKFQVSMGVSKRGGHKLIVQGRPKKFTAGTLKEVAKNYPADHEKGTTKLKPGRSRNHILPWMSIRKFFQSRTRGLSQAAMKAFLGTIDTSKFVNTSFRNKLDKTVKGGLNSLTEIAKAFAVVLQEFYNRPENLYVGLSLANSTGGAEMKARQTTLKKDWALPKKDKNRLSAKDKADEQKEMKDKALDFPFSYTATQKANTQTAYQVAWGKNQNKYVPTAFNYTTAPYTPMQ